MKKNSERLGPENPNAKLKDADVAMLRRYRKGGWSHADLSLLFGISESRSSEICRGKGYPNAGGPISGTRDALYFSSVRKSAKEKLSPEIGKLIRSLHADELSHGAIVERVRQETGVEISKSLVGLVLRGHTRY